MKRKKMSVGVAIMSVFAFLVVFCIALIALAYAVSLKSTTQSVPVYSLTQAPQLKSGQALKIMSWNVQFMAGKGYVFFFDMPGGKGPHSAPSAQSVAQTLAQVAQIISRENPDVILLQEVDDGAKRTGKQDQLQQLLELISKDYSQHASAFYWKAPFVPHPKIMGSVGLKLSIISRYKIENAKRIALPQVARNWLSNLFDFKRALLEVRFSVEGVSQQLVVLNGHLEAFGKDGLVKKQEIEFLNNYLSELDKENLIWVLGADMNLLAPGFYERIPDSEKVWFMPSIDLLPLYKNHLVLPILNDMLGPDSLLFRTHFPNRMDSKGLDKTIDFMLHSKNLQITSFSVRQADCLRVSDHMPLIAQFVLTK